LVGLGGLGALVGLGGLAALVGLGGVRVRRALRQSEQEEFVMDGITLLKNDHKTVEKLFKAFEKAGERAKQAKAKTVQQIIEELSVHAAIEEQIFYPAIRSEVQGTEDEVLESLEEHHIVKWVLSELDGMSPEDERFDAKVTVLIENVRHHVEEEETELFPQVRKALGRKRLGEIGDAMETAKKTAPKRPHPRGGDTPPANIISGLVAGAVDRVRDAASVS
jgi:hemerythrin superfamily protein